MADPVLAAGQYSIGQDGDPGAFVFGGIPGGFANSILAGVPSADPGAIVVQDQAVVGHDGLTFGIDTQPGMVVTLTGQAFTGAGNGAAALDAYSALAGAWNDPSVRLMSGAVQVLRACYRGSNVVRRSYGRGRKIMPVYGTVNQGFIPFTAQFQSADGTWYADTPSSLVLTSVPSFRGTLTPPLTPPYQLAASFNYQQSLLVNAGSLPTWPVITFTGPVSYPGLIFPNTPVMVAYQGVLGPTDVLVIDTQPWARTALLNTGTSVAGYLTGDPMISLQMQPGATQVRFTGQDYTGHATCVVTWRNAALAIGGSV